MPLLLVASLVARAMCKSASKKIQYARGSIVEDNSSGWSVFDIHVPSSGLGAGIIVGLIIMMVLLYVLYKRCTRKKSVSRNNEMEMGERRADTNYTMVPMQQQNANNIIVSAQLMEATQQLQKAAADIRKSQRRNEGQRFEAQVDFHPPPQRPFQKVSPEGRGGRV